MAGWHAVKFTKQSLARVFHWSDGDCIGLKVSREYTFVARCTKSLREGADVARNSEREVALSLLL